jgi:Fe-S-cluster containining protein
MTTSLLEDLQSKFKCNQCGKCCAVGGDMKISPTELCDMALNCECHTRDFLRQYIDLRESRDDIYRFRHFAPCPMFNKLERCCDVHTVKPKECREYPFKLYDQGGCSLDDVLICPVAVKMLEDHLKGV